MTAAVAAALVTASAALLGTVLTIVLGGRRDSWKERVRKLERDVELCNRERLRLRRNIELVIGAIVGLIPEPQRLALLHQVSEHSIEDAADDDRERR